MKYLITIIISLMFIINAKAQLQIVSSHPENGAVGVQLTDTISVTFSAPLDTTKKFTDGNFLLTNVNPSQDIWYSQDLKTLFIKPTLTYGTNYFLLFYSVKGEDGSVLETPVIIEFTTSPQFNGVDVSGTVSVNNGNMSPENSLVGLSLQDLSQGDPILTNAAVVDANGNFTIHHVKDSVYYPLAAKDVDKDGQINPGYGDLLALHDSIVVAGQDINNLDFVLIEPELISFTSARLTADSIKAAGLPGDAKLYYISAMNIDSLGRTDDWSFYYISPQQQKCYSVDINLFSNTVEQTTQDVYNWISQMRPVGDSVFAAADPENFVINADNQGGNFFRYNSWADTLELEIELNLGNLSQANFGDLIPGDNNFYWGLDYRVRPVNSVDWNDIVARLRFLADYKTGNILIVSDVKNDQVITPANFKLEQNYPNPFNPSTKIKFQIPSAGTSSIKFTQLKIYDILGNEVATLINKQLQPGNYEVEFNANGLPSGVYFYKLTSGNFTQTKKMVLIR